MPPPSKRLFPCTQSDLLGHFEVALSTRTITIDAVLVQRVVNLSTVGQDGLFAKMLSATSGRRIASRPALTVALRAFEFADELAPPCTSRVSTACQTDSVDVHTCTALLDSRCNQDRHGPTGRRPQRRIRERGDALSSHGVVGSPAPLSSAEQWPSSLLFFSRSRTRGPSGEPVW